jgi:ParB/RepB/Spo0J family partition protein
MGEVMQGEPVKLGHHSEKRHRRDLERVHTLAHRAIDDGKKAQHLADRAEASARYEAHRKNPGVTLRRLDKLRADLRRIEKWQRGESAGGFKESIGNPETVAELARRHDEVTEQIQHWEGVIADAESRGFKAWGRDDFTKGDFAKYSGRWFQVLRVNAKSVSIPHIHNGIGKKVVRLGDGHISGTWTAPYDGVSGRMSAEEMAAHLNPAPAEDVQEAAGAELAAVAPVAEARTAPGNEGQEDGEQSAPVVDAESRGDSMVGEETASDLREEPENSSEILTQIGLAKGGSGMCVSNTPTHTEDTMTAETTTTAIETTTPAKPARKPRKATPAKPKATRKTPAKKVIEPTNVITTRERTTAVQKAQQEAQKTSLRTIPTDKIVADPDQPRQHFDETKLNELAASMKKLGQLQPVSVRYLGPKNGYMLIMGERRLRAAQIAGLTTMKAVVEYGIEAGDRETLAKAVAENVGREDMTPIEEAKAFQRLIDADYTIEEVVEMVGKSWNFVDMRLALLKLIPSMQEALIKGVLPVGLAWYVAQINAGNQAIFLGRWARGAFNGVRDAETFAQACRAEEQRIASQGSMFVLAETIHEDGQEDGAGTQGAFGEMDIPVDERDRIQGDRAALVKKIGSLSKAGEILTEIAAMDPGELALLLSGAHGGIPGNRMRIDHLKDVAAKASTRIRQAQAVASVRAGALQVAPDAEAVTA